MRLIKKIGLMITLCLSLLSIECSGDDNKRAEEKTPTEQYTDEVILLRNFLATSLDIDVKKITYNVGTSIFTIDKDVIMPLDQVRDHFNYSDLKSTNKTNQRADKYKMKPEFSASIKVYVSPEVSLDWKIAINQAVDNWNTTNSSIAITIVNESTDRTINRTAFNGANTVAVAQAYLPYYDGQPRKLIQINTYYNNMIASKKVSVITHELGHNLGFNHVDDLSSPLIPCTPLLDSDSVMFPITSQWSGFSYFDNIAISTLYPVAVETKKLYRYKKGQYYFYTTDPCEIVPSKDGYVFEGGMPVIYIQHKLREQYLSIEFLMVLPSRITD